MSASSATLTPMAAQPADDRIEVPGKWRVGQVILTLCVIALAVYYYTLGWHSPKGEVEANLPAKGHLLALIQWYAADAPGFLVLTGLIWLTTPTAGVIALATFQEALRRRWMTALLAFGMVSVGLSSFFTFMQPGEEQKFLRDFGLGFIIILTILMAIFLGVALVPPEIERRTIFTILSKPVTRQEFLIGKFLGLCWTLFVNLALMGIMFMVSYAIFKVRIEKGLGTAMNADMAGGHPGLMFDLQNIASALILQMGQLAVLSAMALLLSLIVSGITAIVFCFVIYFGGQASSYWEHLSGGEKDVHGQEVEHLSPRVAAIVKTVYIVLPRLDRFDVRERLVNDTPVAFNYMWKAFGSGLTYVAVLLIIAYLVFSDREF